MSALRYKVAWSSQYIIIEKFTKKHEFVNVIIWATENVTGKIDMPQHRKLNYDTS
jgi:hypothetical protein